MNKQSYNQPYYLFDLIYCSFHSKSILSSCICTLITRHTPSVGYEGGHAHVLTYYHYNYCLQCRIFQNIKWYTNVKRKIPFSSVHNHVLHTLDLFSEGLPHTDVVTMMSLSTVWPINHITYNTQQALCTINNYLLGKHCYQIR